MISTRRIVIIASVFIALPISGDVRAATLNGVVQKAGALPVSAARITLFTSDLSFFLETRSTGAGAYGLNGVPTGSYRLGCAARGFDYTENAITISEPGNTADFALSPETHPGVWEVI